MKTETKAAPESPRQRFWLLRLAFRVVVFGCVVIAAALVAAGFVAFLVYQHVTQPGIAGEPIKITIPEGATGKDIASLLAKEGLVEHEAFFRIAMRLDRSGKPLKHGWYWLPRGLSATELLQILQKGPNRLPSPDEIPPDRKITVPEGLTLAQMSELFEHPQAFLEAASDAQFVRKIGIAAPTLEGFLMPNTYFFDAKPTERQAIERMIEEFERRYAELTAQTPPPEGMDKLKIVTIASLVEEEARVNEERSDVAAVIYNRLRKGMPLQLDSTLQFALRKYGQRILYEDREVDSPYNTYKYAGLPPGPISSPGVESLRAALNPTLAEYIYFVSNADGKTHTFSSTEAEHLRAVQRFRKAIAVQRRELEGKKSADAQESP